MTTRQYQLRKRAITSVYIRKVRAASRKWDDRLDAAANLIAEDCEIMLDAADREMDAAIKDAQEDRRSRMETLDVLAGIGPAAS